MLDKRLKQLRQEKNLLQKDIAKFLNITTSAYGFYEQGKRNPDAITIRKLAQFYNVTVDYLLGITDVPTSSILSSIDTAAGTGNFLYDSLINIISNNPEKFLREYGISELDAKKLDYILGKIPMESNITCCKNSPKHLETTPKDKTLEDDLMKLMIRHGIINDKNKINKKHIEFIKYAIELYKDEQNNK